MSELRHILLVEDNKADIRLMQEALKEHAPEIKISAVESGVEALEFLEKEERPDLIILDLNLPKKDGREVLKEVKASNTLKTIPIIILTTSESEHDIKIAYELHANCYLAKPIDLDEFNRIVVLIQKFWLETVRLCK